MAESPQRLMSPNILTALHYFQRVQECKLSDYTTFAEYVREFSQRVSDFNAVPGGVMIDDRQKQTIFLLNLGSRFNPWVERTGDTVKLAGYPDGGRDVGFDEVVSLVERHWARMQSTSERAPLSISTSESPSNPRGGLNGDRKRRREHSISSPLSQQRVPQKQRLLEEPVPGHPTLRPPSEPIAEMEIDWQESQAEDKRRTHSDPMNPFYPQHQSYQTDQGWQPL